MTSGPSAVQETHSPDAIDVPADHLCVRCGYPSGRSGSRRCPECGWEATEAELHAAETRQEALARWRDGERARVTYRWLGVLMTYGVGAGLVVWSGFALMIALLGLFLAVTLTWPLGDCFASRCRGDRRAYLDMVWARSLWMLHLPWLASPLFVFIAIFVGLIDLWAGQAGRGAYHWAVISGFFLWLAGCILAFVVWWRARVRTLAASGYRLGRADAMAFIVGAAVIAGSMGMGFVAGVATAIGVAEWLGLEDFLWA